MICGVDDLPIAGRHIEATVCWMSENPLRAGEHLALKHTTRTVRAAVESIDALLDVTTQKDETPPDQLELNDIARLTLRTSAPVVADPYAENRTTGAFILIDQDSNDTVGAGMVRAVRETAPREEPHSPGVTWHESGLAPRPALERARHARRDRVADRPARRRASRRSPPRSSAASSSRATPRTSSTATTCATACRATWPSPPPTGRRTSAASPTSRG